MESLTIILFERLGLLLIIAFVMTRTPGFKALLYRKYSFRMSLVHALVFGVFGIVCTTIGIIITDEGMIRHSVILFPVEDDQFILSMSLVAIVIAGLLGGPTLGFGAGLISGIHIFLLGGVGALANGLVNPITGLLAGLTARFFSNERVISPLKALFIGVFPPVLHMQLLLIVAEHQEKMITLVNTAGFPLVLTSSTAIAIFTAMIGIVLREQENNAALASKQAFTIAKEALPYLQKDSKVEVAEGLADLLYSRLKLAAVSVTDKHELLVHKGTGSEQRHLFSPVRLPLAQRTIRLKKMQVAYSRTDLPAAQQNCQLGAAIFIPIIKGEDVPVLIIFYFRKAEHISPVELMMAQGLGQFISDQLNMVEAEKLKDHIRDAELRNLQAQINPHFLFNTLQLIAGLIRENPDNARRLTLKLASYMRFNLRLVSKSLVELERECAHAEAYTAIIQERFKGRIQIEFVKPEHLSSIYIPPSTIQPLIENSVQHGLKNVINNAKIDIHIKKEMGKVTISVRDNGSGFSKDILPIVTQKPLASEMGGVGIYNVNQRLIQLLGESSRLHIRNLPEGGSEVRFSIPDSNEFTEKQVIG